MKIYLIKDKNTDKYLRPRAIGWISVWLNKYYLFDRRKRLGATSQFDSKKEVLDTVMSEAFGGKLLIYEKKNSAERTIKEITHCSYTLCKKHKQVFDLIIVERDV